MIQNGKIKMNFDNDVEGKPKISVNIEEIRYNDRNLYQNVNMNNNRMKRPYSGYEENYRIKSRKNNSFSKKVEIIFIIIIPNNDISNNAAYNEFEKTI